MSLKVTPVNPSDWSQQYGFHQGVIVENPNRTLYLAGQTSIDDDGELVHAGDIRAQLQQCFDNIDKVLASAEMDKSNIVQMTIFTTDVDALLGVWDVLMEHLPAAGNFPPESLIGVARLAFPDLMVEIEAVAVD